jgi:omega-6 fatty acid desaturase (delta-12 desaturase)
MPPDLAHIHDAVRPYTSKNDLRAAWEVLSTLLVLIPLGIALYQFRDHTAFWLLGSIPGALMLVRMFSLGHEAGHAALFRSRRTNLWVGRFLALFSLIPYGCWHRMHYVHHQRLGQIHDAHEGYMWLMTRRQYAAASRVQRALYRAYHHPVTLFAIGPILQFVVFYRWTGTGATAADHRSIRVTNVVIVSLALLVHLTIGLGSFVYAFAPMCVVAAGMGSWMFFTQHMTAHTYWAEDDAWDRKDALLRGSTFYDLPAPLRWCIANAGYHPLHHLNAGIPCYRLRECWEAHAAFFAGCRRVTLLESLRNWRLAVWDEDGKRMAVL